MYKQQRCLSLTVYLIATSSKRVPNEVRERYVYTVAEVAENLVQHEHEFSSPTALLRIIHIMRTLSRC